MKKWPTINGQLVLITSLFLGPVTASFISGDGASLLYPYSLVCKLLSWIYTNQPCRFVSLIFGAFLQFGEDHHILMHPNWRLWTPLDFMVWLIASKPLGKREKSELRLVQHQRTDEDEDPSIDSSTPSSSHRRSQLDNRISNEEIRQIWSLLGGCENK